MFSIRRTIVAVAAVAAMVPVSAQAASACEGTVVEVGSYYVDDRGFTDYGVWIYEESNSIAGLQRGNETAGGGVDCTGVDAEGNPIPADTLIF